MPLSVSELLSDLGDTVDDVAKYMRSHDFRGMACSNEQCPVANYLRFNGIKDVEVYAEGICYTVDGEPSHDDVPGPVVGFIYEFDRNCYPELECITDTEVDDACF